jgi:hypothetical protein
MEMSGRDVQAIQKRLTGIAMEPPSIENCEMSISILHWETLWIGVSTYPETKFRINLVATLFFSFRHLLFRPAVDQGDEGKRHEESDDDADETQTRDTFRGAVDFREDVIVAFQESEQYCDQRLANESKSEAKPKLTDVDDREVDGDEDNNGLSSR